MHWKKFKTLDSIEKKDEANYIIGLDIGNETSTISFYNQAAGSPETIDISGGYGKPSFPTVIQYIHETGEWVFGEYAILNRGVGRDITIEHIIERLGHFDYIDINNKSVALSNVLALFIKELVQNVKNINPKAEIVGIIATVSTYLSKRAKEELERAFKQAGLEKELIGFVTDREAALQYFINDIELDTTLLLDYGSREVRGGLFIVDKYNFTNISSNFDERLGTSNIDNDVYTLFENFINKQKVESNEQLYTFAYQHKDILFQKNIRTKPIKLYFNFTYPPFQESVSYEQVEKLLTPYKRQFARFIKEITARSGQININDIKNVICIGGGFEMLWVRDYVKQTFNKANILIAKSPKLVMSEGAALIAARLLDIEKNIQINIKDQNQFTSDIGISAGEYFLPLIESPAFWWSRHEPKLVLLTEEVEKFNISLFDKHGNIKHIGEFVLDNLPKRPRRTTRLSFEISFSSSTKMNLKIMDIGFGELFPTSGLVWIFEFDI